MIFNLVFAVLALIVLVRWLWPPPLPLWAKLPAALLMLGASRFHLWNRVSSGSVFAPEFPRSVVILFNWAFGALVLFAVLQLVIDVGALLTILVPRELVREPNRLRYAAATLAALLAAIGIANALRVPPVRDAPAVLFDHQPRRARAAGARGVALRPSGHTHDGMIIGLDRLVARGSAGFVSGRYELGDMTLHAGNGTGLWPGFALRLGVPSGITRITLRCI